jgi:DNA polymerase-3 subunit alpha
MFVNLHNHSAQGSLLDGLSRVKELAQRAVELEQPAVALTEHGSLYSMLKFYKACKEIPDSKVKPILGCEVYVTPDRTYKERDVLNKYCHLVLLAKNQEGLENLIKIVSDASLVGFYQKPRTDLSMLSKHGRGIIALSACRSGEIPELLAEAYAKEEFDENIYQSAVSLAKTYSEVFDEFYLEVEASITPEQYACNKAIVGLAKDTGIPLVATNDSHYLLKEDAEIHEVLLAIQTNAKMSDEKRFKLDSWSYWFKSEAETREYLKACMHEEDIEEAISNTVKIADQCNVELELGRILFPKVDIPSGFTNEEYLQLECIAGLDKLIKDFKLDAKVYEDRLNYELNIVLQAGLASYFLMVQDIYNYAKKENIPYGPGRGSAAGALISYCLGITSVDPIKHNLSFERFWCPGRVGMPDIDCDFAPDSRPKLFQYIIDKYGIERCAHIATFGTMNPRMLIRDVCRVLDIPLDVADTIAKSVPEMITNDDTGDKVHITIDNALEESEDLQGWQERYPYLFKVARRLEGLPRHTSVHAAGIIISPVPLFGAMPLMRNKSEGDPLPVSMFDMGDVEEYGFLKMDLLGVDALRVIWDSVIDIKNNYGINIELTRLPLDDPKVYQTICDLKTFGMFQICTNIGKQMCSQIQPQTFNDLVDILALARPGPMKAGQDKDYVLRKLKIKEVSYLHPLLEPILKKTYGVMLYQEQLMSITRAMGGFDHMMADKYRKAVAKKKAELMIPLKDRFLNGCIEMKTLDTEPSMELWDQMERYGGYCFNESHSVSYAYITYWTAWLKVYYPVEFMAATLTNEYKGSGDDREEKIIEAMFECRNVSIKVLPPNINESKDRFLTVDNTTIRFPLNGAKGVGDAAMAAIVSNCPYDSFEDFMERVPKRACNSRVTKVLILCGAFDSLFPDRLELVKRLFANRKEEYDPLIKIDKATQIRLPKEYNFADRLEWERVLLGAYISGHPLDCLQLDDWKYKLKGSLVTVAGKIYSQRKVEIKKGKSIGQEMAICNIDTKEGQLTVILFPAEYTKFHEKIKKNNIIKVKGRLDERNGERQVVASEVVLPRIPGMEKTKQVYDE